MMPRADYFAFERLEHKPTELHLAGQWDVFLSSYDRSERVQETYNNICATAKHWFVHEEYRLTPSAKPSDAIELTSSFGPPDIKAYVTKHAQDLKDKRVCVDATGFITPHLLVLFRALQDAGLRCFDVLYSDPERYVADEYTEFTIGPVVKVEQVPGYEGMHRTTMMLNDVLVIGAGYDVKQIARSCEAKRNSKKYILTGLPSLQPHMYQESVLQIYQASEWVGSLPPTQRLYASANNPFAVAQILHDALGKEEREGRGGGIATQNTYLCPVGPKPHVVGFAVFYLRERKDTATSIIYPFSEHYPTSTTEGLLRTWQYCIEL